MDIQNVVANSPAANSYRSSGPVSGAIAPGETGATTNECNGVTGATYKLRLSMLILVTPPTGGDATLLKFHVTVMYDCGRVCSLEFE